MGTDIHSGSWPKSWCGGVSGYGIVMVENDEMDRYLQHCGHEDGKKRYTTIEWEVDYADACKCLVSLTKELRQREPGNEVRLVFGFDS